MTRHSFQCRTRSDHVISWNIHRYPTSGPTSWLRSDKLKAYQKLIKIKDFHCLPNISVLPPHPIQPIELNEILSRFLFRIVNDDKCRNGKRKSPDTPTWLLTNNKRKLSQPKIFHLLTLNWSIMVDFVHDISLVIQRISRTHFEESCLSFSARQCAFNLSC